MKIGTQEWNNTMYSQHATPYSGIAGWIEKCRVKKILQLANLKESDSLLEVGCEAGNLLVEFPKCKRTVGFDISDSALADAKLLFQKRKKDAEFVQGDACRPLPFSTGEFTVIVCSEMLEHVPDPEICLKNIASLCNEDTKVIISVPNEKPKLKAKKLLKSVGLLSTLFPTIEESQSEWHLQCFDKNFFDRIVNPLFVQKKFLNLFNLHLIALLKLRNQG
jgi:2-polyprenyl-3-methyl-5-hydroxy-6-metoxy-1,4-benzoquinol methylase